jgi:hypothetical protein
MVNNINKFISIDPKKKESYYPLVGKINNATLIKINNNIDNGCEYYLNKKKISYKEIGKKFKYFSIFRLISYDFPKNPRHPKLLREKLYK